LDVHGPKERILDATVLQTYVSLMRTIPVSKIVIQLMFYAWVMHSIQWVVLHFHPWLNSACEDIRNLPARFWNP
jgi:hypothetical protein